MDDELALSQAKELNHIIKQKVIGVSNKLSHVDTALYNERFLKEICYTLFLQHDNIANLLEGERTSISKPQNSYFISIYARQIIVLLVTYFIAFVITFTLLGAYL